MPRIQPHILAGVFGILLVAGLAMLNAWLASQGGGLDAGWLLLLLAPGMLAAHLERAEAGVEFDPDREGISGLKAGIVTAHVAAPLMLVYLVVAVVTTDWEQYATQVGPGIAYAVRDAAVPATAVLSLLAAAIVYAGCGVAGLLGDLVYSLVRNLVR